MKKFLSILITLIMSFSALLGLTACDGNPEEIIKLNGKTAEQIYNETLTVIESNKTNFTFDANYDVEAKITVGEESVPFNMKMYMTCAANGTNLYQKTDMDLGTFTIPNLGSMEMGTMQAEYTFIDGVCYVHAVSTGEIGAYDTKMKMNFDVNEFLEEIGQTEETMYNPLYDFSEEAFNNIKFVKAENDYYFELVINGQNAEDYVTDMLANMNQTAIGMEYGDISYKFFVTSEGAFDHAEIEFDITITAGGMKYEYSYKGSIKFRDVGTTVVTAPADADAYN